MCGALCDLRMAQALGTFSPWYPPPPLYKLRPCPSYSRRRDRNNGVHWRSLYKGGGGTCIRHFALPAMFQNRKQWEESTQCLTIVPCPHVPAIILQGPS